MPFDDSLLQRAAEAVTAYEQARERREPSAVQRALAPAEALCAQVPADCPGQRAIAAHRRLPPPGRTGGRHAGAGAALPSPRRG
ncbi:hypothetical protein [Streptomyces cyanogenus]|uniref:Uncharacterized protein n=1 Tax=Streptomyces cyanogenus TaxID=80860 RepID=A0ABX7U497_STRCY|nr:hypothetical protein [Streptomyces cyanogenus]QTE02914.1 hypothetical protein S1361_36610 [Streptomyces cyanogenus]